MNAFLLLCLSVAAAEPGAPVALEFKDAAVYEGRSVLCFRAIELRDAPARPLTGDYSLAPGAKYGLAPVGPTPETALAIVWIPNASAGPQLWLDANADGRLSRNECHVMSGRELEIPATITVQVQPAPKRVRRTLVFRRSLLDQGLRYAVRGFAQGKIDLAGASHAVLLVDGNADGCFDTVGQDRVWIDLDGDGRFDPLTEQFPLGKPIVKGAQMFVVSSDATASAVRVRLRSGAMGKLRLDLASRITSGAKMSAHLVSDIGEFVVIEKPGVSVPVPAGDYYVSSLRLEIPEPAGQTWTYSFRNDKRDTFAVPAGQERRIALLERLAMEVILDGQGEPIRPAQTVSITPRVIADGSLSLTSCETGAGELRRTAEGSAEILLLAPDGHEISRGMTGFS